VTGRRFGSQPTGPPERYGSPQRSRVLLGGSARSYLTLSTLATVLQSQDGHPHHRLTMPLQHGSLFVRWVSTALRGWRLGLAGWEHLSFRWVFVV
jgi:hypothetical protein